MSSSGMAGSKLLSLIPALVDAGQFDTFVESGQTLLTVISPLDDSLAVYLKSMNYQADSRSRKEEQPIYFAKLNKPPSMERRLVRVHDNRNDFGSPHGTKRVFLAPVCHRYIGLFSALRNLVKSAEGQNEGWLQSSEALTIIRKFGIDYVNFIKECWQPLPHPEGPPQFTSEHYRILYITFSQFNALYLAEPGYEDAPVRDDLLEWFNMHFVEPSMEEGDHFHKLGRP